MVTACDYQALKLFLVICTVAFAFPATKNHGNRFLKWGAHGFKLHCLPKTELLMTSYWAQASYGEPCSCASVYQKRWMRPSKIFAHTHSSTLNLEYSCTWNALHTLQHPEIPRTTLGSPESLKGRCEHRGESPNKSKASCPFQHLSGPGFCTGREGVPG